MSRLLAMSLVALGLGFGCGGAPEDAAAPSSPAQPPRASTSVSLSDSVLSGTATFRGDLPVARPIQMSADPSCARVHMEAVASQSVIVDADGGLKNVFVYVKEGLDGQKFSVPEEPVILDQKGCLYSPRVLGIRAGQTLTMVNSDEMLHNLHAMPTINKGFNIGQPVQGLRTNKSFALPEIMIPIRCEVHRWMASYVGVIDHPFFATTDADGTYTIPGLPPGDYVIEAWHETYKTQQKSVSIGLGDTHASFEFSE